MKKTKAFRWKSYFPLTLRDTVMTVLILMAAAALVFMLRRVGEGDEYASMLFILAVFLISCYTDGYFYGLAASVIGVLEVNYFFTYPYFVFNFTLSGYPLTIVSMMVVSIITSAMTSQIKRQNTLTIEAEREKTRSNLLRAISHDLRTPLTSILGASSAIAENDDVIAKEERLRLLREISEEAQWLIRMVENLLSITRIDGMDGEARIKKVPEAAEEIVSEAVIKLKKRFPEVRIYVKVPGELLMVPMDAMLIEQVIINLLENAVLHGEGATHIELVVSLGAGEAVFEVIDNGKGIDKELLPKLFSGKSRQSGEEGGDRKRSMGIGLSVCSTIVYAHGGRMTARNLPEGGAAVGFWLPLEEERYEH